MRGPFPLMFALALVLPTSACRAPGPAKGAPEIAVGVPVWPVPPAETRISFVRSLSGPQDMGIEKPFFRHLFDALAGKSEEHFVRPTGVAERDEVLYIADPGAQALWILDRAEQRSVKADQLGDIALVSPVAVAVRPDGAVFVADTGLKKVFLLDRRGRFRGIAAEEGLERPAGLAYDPADERLYVVDSVRHRIAVYDSQAKLVRTWGREGLRDGEFNHPSHISIDSTGILLVTDALGFRIQAFDRDGRFLWKFGRHGDGSGDFAAPKGLAADSAGNVYVVDALFDAVQIFNRDGTLLLAFGERGTRAGQFWLPGGIFINSRDEIYVADAYNQRVQVFRSGRSASEETKK